MTLDLPDAPNPSAIKTTDPNASCNLPPQPGDETALEGGVTVGEVFGRPKPEAPDATPAVTQAESSEQPSEQPGEVSQATQATQGEQDATLPPELGLVEQLWTLYREQLAASLEQQATAIALEQAKNKHDEAREKNEAKRSAVQTFLSTFIEQLAAIRDPQAVAIAQSVADSIAEHEASQEPVEEPESDVGCTSMDWDEWRKIPTKEIVSGESKITGLGPKKADALVEKFPTLGDLEDARAEVGKAHKHFCKALVKGIGEQTADAILNAMQARLRIKGTASTEPAAGLPAKVATVLEVESSEPKQSPKKVPVAKVVDEVEPDPEPEDDDSESDDSEPEQIGDSDQDADDEILYADVDDEAEDEIDDTETDTEASSAESDPDEISWAEAYYRQILNDPAEVKAAWGENDKKHSAAWTTGNTSQEDWPVDSCPFDETRELEQAKDWVRGWTAASVLQMDL